MSHLVKQVNQAGVEIKSLDLLAKSVAKLGGVLHTDRKVARYYGSNSAACDAVITVPGTTSEIAVIKQPDGNYEIQADTHYGEIQQFLGANSDNLFQRYRAEELIEDARNNNWNVEEVYNPDTQELQLQFER